MEVNNLGLYPVAYERDILRGIAIIIAGKPE